MRKVIIAISCASLLGLSAGVAAAQTQTKSTYGQAAAKTTSPMQSHAMMKKHSKKSKKGMAKSDSSMSKDSTSGAPADATKK